MLNFLIDNWGTILVSLLLAAVIFSVVVSLLRDKRKGMPPGCGCGCTECRYSENCRPK